MIAALVITMLAALPTLVTPAPSQVALPATKVGTPHVVITTSDNNETRTYVAKVFDADSNVISNATLDMSAMTDNPDVRIGTEAMEPVAGVPDTFTRTLQYPASGDWVLVVRVHDPIPFVQLLTERVDSVNLPNASAHADSPSRRHLREIAPNFSQTYDPMHGIGSTDPQPLLAAQTAAAASAHRHDESAAPRSTEAAAGNGWNWFWAAASSCIAALAILNIRKRH
jgi:hypothetical protein